MIGHYQTILLVYNYNNSRTMRNEPVEAMTSGRGIEASNTHVETYVEGMYVSKNTSKVESR